MIVIEPSAGDAATLQAPDMEVRGLTVVPDDLHQIAAPSAEAEDVAAGRVALQHFLHEEAKPLRISGVARRKPHLHERDRDHLSALRPRASLRTALGIERSFDDDPLSVLQRGLDTRGRRREGGADIDIGMASAVITAGTKPGVDPPCRAKNARRHITGNDREMLCRRAVAETCRGPLRLSRTIRSFAAALQRRPVSTVSSRPKALSV